MAQAQRFVRPLDEFLLHRQCQCQGFWSHALQQQRPNRSIQGRTRNALTGSVSVLNAFVLTKIIGHDALPAALVVAHRHALATATADQAALVTALVPRVAGRSVGGA